MILRHSRIVLSAELTSSTDSPVVVHPLTDSNKARENGNPSVMRKGQAEKRMTTTQLSTTMTPPS